MEGPGHDAPAPFLAVTRPSANDHFSAPPHDRPALKRRLWVPDSVAGRVLALEGTDFVPFLWSLDKVGELLEVR
jgi:hypothetical protein